MLTLTASRIQGGTRVRLMCERFVAALLVCWERLRLGLAHDGLELTIRLQHRMPRPITGALVLNHADPVESRAFLESTLSPE